MNQSISLTILKNNNDLHKLQPEIGTFRFSKRFWGPICISMIDYIIYFQKLFIQNCATHYENNDSSRIDFEAILPHIERCHDANIPLPILRPSKFWDIIGIKVWWIVFLKEHRYSLVEKRCSGVAVRLPRQPPGFKPRCGRQFTKCTKLDLNIVDCVSTVARVIT